MADDLNIVDALRRMVDARLYEVNTSLPGVIVSYANGRANIKPTPKKRFPDGDVLEFPVLQNVRVCWPSFAGGAAGVKGPVLPGDKCLIVIAQQAVDGTDDPRRFDMSDAYAIPCELGAATGQGADNSSMTLYYGAAFVRVTDAGRVEVNAPGGMTVAGELVQEGGELSSNGVILDAHVHSGVVAGGSNTGGPI